ncbi:MAG: hypothetical protein AAGI23_08830 [Bacteroidota bacterium]
MYKQILFSIALLLVSIHLAAQTFEINKSSGKIHVEGLNDLKIEGYDGNKIVITSKSYSHSDNERAKGLSAINAKGIKDNTGIGLVVQEEDNEIRIMSVKKYSDDYEMKVPKGMAIAFENGSNRMDKLHIEKIQGEVEVELQFGSVELENVSGPLSISTVHGHIEATFNQLSSKGPSTLYSVHGLVDVTLPAGAKLDIHLSSNFGDMFTDFDVKVPAESSLSSKRVTGTINGGGTELRINSNHNNIYLRKG